jgi:hypothetical protein
MALTPTQLSELTDLAKDFYSNVYTKAVNVQVPLKLQFERLENAMFTGKKWIFAVKLAMGGGSANAGANKTLPEEAEGQFDQGEMNLVRTYTRMAGDNFLFEVTKQQQGSYRPALKELMEDRLEQHDLEVNRQLYSAGNGVLAKVVAGGASSATQTLELDYGVVNGGAGTRHLYIGDQVRFYKADLSTLIGGRKVIAVDNAANTITLDSTIDTTVVGGPHVVTRATADTDNIAEKEAIGLLASVTDSGSLHNIPGAGRWKAYRLHNNGSLRDLTDPMVLDMVSTLRARTGKTPNLAVARTGVVLKYSEQFLPIRRIMGQDIELKGGYKPINALIHGGGSIPVLEDNDCPNSRLFMLNTEAFRMADLIGTGWFDGDGAQFTRVTDKDAIEGYIRKYWGVATVFRSANGVIEDLNDIAAIDRVF